MPTYNQADYLKVSLKSALAQRCDDFEVVVSNNHSTDHTEEVVRSFSHDPRLRILRPERFLPVHESFRYVLGAARGKYINFLSSDDELYPDFLQVQLETLERHPSISLSFTAGEMIDQDGQLLQINRLITGSFIRRGYDELRRNIFHLRATGIALLMRRSAYDEMGGLRTAIPDWEACVKLLCFGDVAYHDQVLAKVRIWTNSGRMAQRVALMRDCSLFFDEVEPFVLQRYPELASEFRRARRLRARMEIGMLDDVGDLRAQAREHILRISDDPSVRLKLFAWERLHMRPWFVAYARSDAWLRATAKQVIWKGRSLVGRS